MSLLTELKEMGVNTDEALARFMNNSAFYERMLGKFVANAESTEVMSFIDSGDFEQAEKNAHTLKGVTGNLSLTPLFKGYDGVVSAIRSGDFTAAKQIMSDTLPVQEKILDCIKKYK